jgi:hypothetical protein
MYPRFLPDLTEPGLLKAINYNSRGDVELIGDIKHTQCPFGF